MITGELALQWGDLTATLGRFVARRVPSADADDVVQEALVRIHRGLSALRDDERLGPWVYRVTRSAIGDYLRKRARGVELDPEIELSQDDEEEDLTPMLVGCLSRFIAQLPSPYREAITLTDLEGMTQKDAAAMVGISLSGMKSRVQRGRDQLREMFERCCELTMDGRGRVIECDPGASCAPADRGCNAD